MHGINISILSENPERLALLEQRVESTQLGHVVVAHGTFPVSAADAAIRRMQDSRTEVVLVDVAARDTARAMLSIELIQANVSNVAVFAVGAMTDPSVIVAAMRAGAREYLERDANSEAFSDALRRYAASTSKARAFAGRARILAVSNAKGGAGATSVAVNTAVALEQSHGRTVLVDFALLGHAALHLNVRPTFGIADALQNLHRMDSALLQSFVSECRGGLHLMAGPQQPLQLAPSAVELARLFDLLVSHFQYVIVDCSNRADSLFRMIADLSNAVLVVAQTDVVSLWSAARIHAFLEQGSGRDRVRLILNRFKKIPGFTDEDVQKVTNCKLLWKLPNNFHAAGPAIDKGIPIAFHESSELGRSYRALAGLLAEASSSGSSMDLGFTVERESGKKRVGSLLISPLRAGQ
jgi:pilus assembly protein CpaE